MTLLCSLRRAYWALVSTGLASSFLVCTAQPNTEPPLVDPAVPEIGSSGSVAPEQRIALEMPDAAWKAVERIDDKIANAILILTVFSASVPILIGLFEFLRHRELRDIKKEINETVDAKVSARITELEKNYRAEMIGALTKAMQRETSEHLRILSQSDGAASRTLAAFLLNELPGDPSANLVAEDLRRVFELQKSLHQVEAGDDGDVLAALSYLHAVVPHSSPVTLSQLLQFMLLVEHQRKIRTWENRDVWERLVTQLESLTGLSRENAFGEG